MKKIILLLLTFCLAFSLTLMVIGCKKDPPRLPGGNNMPGSATEPIQKPDHDIPDKTIDMNQLLYMLYDDRAWLEDDQGRTACYNGRGERIFVLSPEQSPATDFESGFALIEELDAGGASLIDKNGQLVFTAESLGADGILPSSGFLRDGYVLLYLVGEETVDGASFSLGVVDTSGRWVMPMVDKNIATAMGCFTPSEFLSSYEYMGENVWMRKVETLGFDQYHLSLGDIFTGQMVKTHYISYFDREISTFQFADKKIYGYDPQEKDVLYSIGLDGYETDVLNLDPLPYQTGYNLYDFDASRNLIVAKKAVSDPLPLLGYDLNGNLLFESKYGVYAFIGLKDGIILYRTINDAGTPYLVALDSNGTLLFEPVKFDEPEYKSIYVDESEKVLYWDQNYIILDNRVLNMRGETVREGIKPDDYEIVGYRNGIIRLCKGTRYGVSYDDCIWEKADPTTP